MNFNSQSRGSPTFDHPQMNGCPVSGFSDMGYHEPQTSCPSKMHPKAPQKHAKNSHFPHFSSGYKPTFPPQTSACTSPNPPHQPPSPISSPSRPSKPSFSSAYSPSRKPLRRKSQPATCQPATTAPCPIHSQFPATADEWVDTPRLRHPSSPCRRQLAPPQVVGPTAGGPVLTPAPTRRTLKPWNSK